MEGCELRPSPRRDSSWRKREGEREGSGVFGTLSAYGETVISFFPRGAYVGVIIVRGAALTKRVQGLLKDSTPFHMETLISNLFLFLFIFIFVDYFYFLFLT